MSVSLNGKKIKFVISCNNSSDSTEDRHCLLMFWGVSVGLGVILFAASGGDILNGLRWNNCLPQQRLAQFECQK